MKDRINYVGAGVGFGVGLFVGIVLSSLVTNFFGDLWSTEAGGPWIVIYSPLIIPTLVGIITGLLGGILPSIIYSIISGVFYIIVGVVIILVGAIFSAGWESLTWIIILVGLVSIGSPIIIVIVGK